MYNDVCIRFSAKILITRYINITILLQLSYFINMDQMHLFKNGSIISMKYAAHGTLLSVVAAYKEAWVSLSKFVVFYNTNNYF